MENRDKYLWRPNDNSVKTKLRYDLEATHWIDSIKSNTASRTATFSEALGTLGLIISLILNILLLIVLSISALVKWIIKVWPKKKDKYEGIPHFDNRPELTGEEMQAIVDGAIAKGKPIWL